MIKASSVGLLESALARPRSTVFGADAYPTLDGKAAALLHSLARNHALVDAITDVLCRSTAGRSASGVPEQ